MDNSDVALTLNSGGVTVDLAARYTTDPAECKTYMGTIDSLLIGAGVVRLGVADTAAVATAGYKVTVSDILGTADVSATDYTVGYNVVVGSSTTAIAFKFVLTNDCPSGPDLTTIAVPTG